MKRLYISRPRKIVLKKGKYSLLDSYEYNPKYNYHINEFRERYENKIVRFMDNNLLDIITSNDIEVEQLPFIVLHTKNYPFGISYKFFYYPIFKFVLTEKLLEYELHDPINDNFIKVNRPFDIIIRHLNGYEVLTGHTAAYFILGLEKLLCTEISNEKLLEKRCPKNRISYYEKMKLQNVNYELESLKMNIFLREKFSEELVNI